MVNVRRAHLASLICLAGATVQIIYGLLTIRFHFYERGYEWAEVLWAAANVGMIGGVIGMLALDVARPRWLAMIGALLAILGHLIRIVASALIVLAPSRADTYTPLVLISILLMVSGMGSLGMATLLGKQLHGWQAWTPLLVVLFALIIAPTYNINLYLHFILLGVWGVPWMLVGYMVYRNAAKQEQVMPDQASSAGSESGARLTQPH